MHAVITSGLWLHMRYQCQGKNKDLKRELCNGSTFQEFFYQFQESRLFRYLPILRATIFGLFVNIIAYSFYIYNNY